MHKIEIVEAQEGLYNVLINGFAYKLHKGLDADTAEARAIALRNSYRSIGEKARIIRFEEHA
jgi:hypothetical protein